MAASRSLKDLVNRRRRVDDEEGSQSEGSEPTLAGDDDVSTLGSQSVDASNGNGASHASKGTPKARCKNKHSSEADGEAGKSADGEEHAHPVEPVFKLGADTEGMMRGLTIDEQPEEVLDFEDVGDSVSVAAEKRTQFDAVVPNTRADRPADRQRREHEEYRRKRDSDPAFIPNRGNFFMHDTRGVLNGRGPAPERGAFAGRGRGRGVGGPLFPGNHTPRAERPQEQAWKHDLHEVINEEPLSSNVPTTLTRDQQESARIFPKSQQQHQHTASPALPLSRTVIVGKVPVRVFLPCMTKALTFQEPLAVKRYMQLPDHRPPLRRDKPVRVFVPGLGPRYIFPTAERSFVFIPRQLRPNQRGYGGNAYQRGSISYGPHSRRTSAYGGSMYSASVAASRRSSIANRDGAFSPASFSSGFPGQNMNRPYVNLPPGGRMYSNGTSPAGPLSGNHTPTGQILHTYPLPQNPKFTGTPTAALHQPRPQKTISVTGIESPAALQQARGPSTGSEQQPFHSQLPAHMVEQNPYPHQQGPYNAQVPSYDYPPQAPPGNTTLSGIPEHAMHAQQYQAPNMYYPQYPAVQQPYYYPQQPAMPMYMPTQSAPAPQQAFMAPQQPPAPAEHQDQAPSGMVAHESNGMVFYLPASEVPQQQQAASTQQYQPAESFVPSYAMPGLPPPTPGPETSGYYYPPVDVGMAQGWGYPQ